MKLVFLGLSLTSSWGNGHATTYRGLLRELARRGHELWFLEHDQPWYAAHRDLPNPDFCQLHLYRNLEDLRQFARLLAEADGVVLGSYVPHGPEVGEWVLRHAEGVTAFYDIDTPVTLARLAAGDCEYLTPALIPRFDLYLSFTGGPTLPYLESHYGARKACAFHCSADLEIYHPVKATPRWSLGYLGTYSADRQPPLERLLIEPARILPEEAFTVAGSLYPPEIQWPVNVERIEHLPPAVHPPFYRSQRFTLNITRHDMFQAGWSPSIRVFEAAACGTPLITDRWPGLESFFEPGREILVADSAADVCAILRDYPEHERRLLAERAREKVLAQHTSAHRAAALESLLGGGARQGQVIPSFRQESGSPVTAARTSHE